MKIADVQRSHDAHVTELDSLLARVKVVRRLIGAERTILAAAGAPVTVEKKQTYGLLIGMIETVLAPGVALSVKDIATRLEKRGYVPPATTTFRKLIRQSLYQRQDKFAYTKENGTWSRKETNS